MRPGKESNRFDIQHTILIVLFFLFVSAAIGDDFRSKIGYHVWFTSSQEMSLASQVFELTKGVGDWTLFGLHWDDVQQDANSAYDFSGIDPLVDEANVAGLEVILQIMMIPDFAQLDHINSNRSALRDDTISRQRWSSFCTEVVNHFYPSVRHFEIGNEPNGPDFYQVYDEFGVGGAHVSYPEYLHIAYDAMHAAADLIRDDPDTLPLVVLGRALAPIRRPIFFNDDPDLGIVLAEKPDALLRKIYHYMNQNGVDKCFNVLSYHPYGPIWDNRPDYHADPTFVVVDDDLNAYDEYSLTGTSSSCTFMYTRELHAVLDSLGDGAKQIFGTECGPPLSTFHEPDSWVDRFSEEEQGFWAGQYLTQWLAWDFTGPLLWWNLHSQNYNPPSDPHPYVGWGVLREDWSERPAYTVWHEFGNSSSNSIGLHVGVGPEFLFEDFTAELATLVLSAAAISDTIRIYLHAKDEAYYGNPVFLQLDTLPETASLTFL